MTMQQPEALRLADKYEAEGFLGDQRFAQDQWCGQAAAELRRQHARIAEMESEAADNARILGASAEKELALRARVEELERELAAIGAGGVEPLRSPKASVKHSDAIVFANDRPDSGSDWLMEWAIDAEDLIRSQHAMIVELNDQLAAIGAGGVEPLRKRAAVKESLTPASTVNQQLTVPTFSPTAQRKLTELQSKGFRVVGYTMEHCNVLQDNRRCTVDYNGLVRRVPSAEQEVAKERAARQAAQVEVVELKERIARAGVEQRRAVLEEREACAAACDPQPGIRYSPNSQSARQQCAAAIRARQ